MALCMSCGSRSGTRLSIPAASIEIDPNRIRVANENGKWA
jgi:hypothetical protein